MTSEAIVHVVDDDASYLEAIARLLRAAGFPVRTFHSGADFLSELSSDTAGCVIADLAMPGLDGLELQRTLSESQCLLPVVFLTGRGDVPTSVVAMKRGAVNFIEKRAPKEQLMLAVLRALEVNAAARAAHEARDAVRRRFAALTEREFEVLEHVLLGRKNTQIASDLGLHERTVKLHRSSITRKVGVRSVPELTVLSDQAGLFKHD